MVSTMIKSKFLVAKSELQLFRPAKKSQKGGDGCTCGGNCGCGGGGHK